MFPKPPNPTQNDIQFYLSKAAPIQLGTYKLWQKTLLQTLAFGETLPCPFLVQALIEEVRPNPSRTLEHRADSFQDTTRRTVQERRYTDPIFDKAMLFIANLPNGALPENLAFILNRAGENLPLPLLEISPGQIRQFQQAHQSLDKGSISTKTHGEMPWPPWGTETIEAMEAPRFALNDTDLALLESGGANWSPSERQWFSEVYSAKQWFLQWRKSPPQHRLLGNCLVWESRQNYENQQEGGLETLVPKGNLENLLPSELIWIEESNNLFSWKWNQGELLYFGREQSTVLRPFLSWNLIWDPIALDWQFWAKGCPGRMGAMALGWILSLLETVHLDRGPWDLEAQWVLLEKPGADWEQLVKPLRHIVKSLWPHHSEWGRIPANPGQSENGTKHTHQCSINFGCSKSVSNSINLHPQTEGVREIPSNLTLVGTPQSHEDWLEWDERVMNDLGLFWTATGDTNEAK